MERGKFVIGIDGGATKTKVALANLKGQILKERILGSTNLTNVGLEETVKNLRWGIERIFPKKGRVLSICAGLPAVEERPYLIERIKEKIDLPAKIKEKIEIVSDQLIAFSSGTDERDGIVLIAGTGSVVSGWRGSKKVHVSGWGYLADEGSAFWIGKNVFQEILKSIDRRGKKTILKDLVFERFNLKNTQEFLDLVYSQGPFEILPRFSLLCNIAVEKGDEVAERILKLAGKELVLSCKTAIKILKFQKERFPLVLVGGVFNSQFLLALVKNEIKKFSPKVAFVLSREPVKGAVKLALKKIKNENFKN